MRKQQIHGNNKTGTFYQQISNITIYVITPTYSRPVQKAELTRLSQTFQHVDNLHWIVVEDSVTKTELVANFLSNCRLIYTHLNILTPPSYKLQESDPNWLKPRGVLQRNKGIEWLRSQAPNHPGVVYFADDDNTYDAALFQEVRIFNTLQVIDFNFVTFTDSKCTVYPNKNNVKN